MATIALFFAVMILITVFMLCCYDDFKVTRDSAYAVFFAVAGVVLIAMFYGFLHFKPWLN